MVWVERWGDPKYGILVPQENGRHSLWQWSEGAWLEIFNDFQPTGAGQWVVERLQGVERDPVTVTTIRHAFLALEWVADPDWPAGLLEYNEEYVGPHIIFETGGVRFVSRSKGKKAIFVA